MTTPTTQIQARPLKVKLTNEALSNKPSSPSNSTKPEPISLHFSSPNFEISPIETRISNSTPTPIQTSPVARFQNPSFEASNNSIDLVKSPARNETTIPAPTVDNPGEDESVALARMLMAQEAMESYGALSADYLRYNANQYSQEDLEAFQAVLQDEENEEVEEESSEDMGYEMMLRIGEAIGDVKQERWTMVAKDHIAKLPTYKFDPETVKGLDANDSRCKCLVCQFPYEEKEELRELPCKHCFHTECIDTWLADNSTCAYCRQPIVIEEKEC